MKIKFKYLFIVVLLSALVSCEEPETPTPNLSNSSAALSANFLFINAASDAPSGGLDFYVNNLKIGSSLPFLGATAGNTAAPITTNNVGANTNIRAKSTSGDIGGVLGANDLIYRAGNTSTNNLQASNGANYTFIALDTINRPLPVRKLNAKNFGDTTFVNLANGAQISVVEKATLSAAAKAKLAAIGTVPLGPTDPGGIRFLLLTDTYSTLAADRAGIRLINAVPNSNIWVRLKPASGTTITLGTNLVYQMAFPGFSPSVGSRSNTLAFTAQAIASGGTSFTYTLEVSTDNFVTIAFSLPNVSFASGKYYTVVVGGQKGKSDARKIAATVALHK